MHPVSRFHFCWTVNSLHIPDRIINTSSVVAFRGSSSMIDYASTKGAIIAFTKALATHLIPKGIRVNAVAYVLLVEYPLFLETN